MKKKLFKLVSMILTIAILSQALCLQMFAAGKGYISELRLSWNSKSADGAKQWLWDNGYDVIDCDLNGGTNGRPWVYLGYKTTDNPDEAITDVKIMNMNGGFVTFDTQEELRSMYSTLFHDGGELLTALGEFRQNYHNGSPYTKAAVEMLNLFYLDNDVPLGDHLLGDVSLEDMIDMRYFSATMPSQMLVSMLSLGMRGADDPHWTDKLSEKLTAEEQAALEEESAETTEEPLETEESTESETGISDTTLPEESADVIPDETVAEATAETLAETEVTETTESLSYEAAPTAEPMTSVYLSRDQYDVYDSLQTIKDLYADYPKLDSESVQLYSELFDGMRAVMLTAEMSLLDYILGCEAPDDAIPLAASLTYGQAVMLGHQGLEFLTTKSISKSDLTNMISEINSIGERAYFWEGREQIDYDHGFAMTVDALANLELSEEGDTPSALYITLTTLCGVLSVVALAFAIYYIIKIVTVYKAVTKYGGTIHTAVQMISMFWNISRYTAATAYSSTASVGTVLSYWAGNFHVGLIISSIAFVALVAITVYLTYRAIKDFYNPDFSDIPWTIADMFTSRDGVSNLVYYHAVLDDENVAGDLNAWEGNSWNALYTTKDKRLGNPITADMLAITDQPEAPQGYLPVTHFGKVVAQNTNVGTYASEKKHYIFFRNNDPSFAGSVFGSTNAGLIFGGIGLAVGTALGAISMGFVNKRKKQAI